MHSGLLPPGFLCPVQFTNSPFWTARCIQNVTEFMDIRKKLYIFHNSARVFVVATVLSCSISTHFWFHLHSGCLFHWSKCTVCTYCMSSCAQDFFCILSLSLCLSREIAAQVLHSIRLLCVNTLGKERAQKSAHSVPSIIFSLFILLLL